MFYKIIILIYLMFLPSFKSFDYYSVKTVKTLVNSAKVTSKTDQQDDVNSNIMELVRRNNYEIEEHNVTTEDGYILTLHRMPPKQKENLNSDIVFLMHGILDSSDSWVLQGPNDALSYILSNKGFDVWMGNARGNKHSSLHTKMNKTQTDYWKFTFEEISTYDLPAMIDYILNVTMKDCLYYVGHSQGTTNFFVLNSLKPEYNAKIRMMFALAPIAWISHAKSPIIKFLLNFEYLLTINTFSSSTDTFTAMEKYFCLFVPCSNILQNIIGYDNKFVNASLLPVIWGHLPSTSSTLQFIHYGQMYRSGNFCRFDFSSNENLVRYGQIEPPSYVLRNISVPIVLFYSNNDWLSDVEDVSILYNNLRNVYNTYLIENFNHMDYMYAGIARHVIYYNIIKEISDLETSEKKRQ